MKYALIAVFAAVCLAAAELPPKPEAITRVGCEAQESHLDKYSWWHVRIWAEYKDGSKWKRVFSIRDGRERLKALKDCDRWLNDLKRAQLQEMKHAR